MSGNHTHDTDKLNKNLKLGLILNTGFTIFEFIIGFFSGSLALMSDAAHNLTDSVSLLISYYANKLSSKQANHEKTYGYGRSGILAALFNGFILLALAFYIFYEAYQRILEPSPVAGKLVAIVALVGIIINGSIALLFRSNKNDLNIRSAFLNMAFDTLASVGALIAGLVIVFTGKTIVDPFISILIGIMLIISAWSVVKEALHILLEGVPENIKPDTVKASILREPMVRGLDDLHIWALSSKEAALSCHLIIEECDLKKSIEIVTSIKAMLAKRFSITHSTIETELTFGPHDDERTDEGL